MKKLVHNSLPLLLLFTFAFTACNEDAPTTDPDITESGTLNLLAARVDAANTEITNINLDNGEQFSFITECMVVSSRVFDRATQSIGYTACDNTFKMVNPNTGAEIASYPLPGPVNMAVVNDAEHVLIGTYYDQGAEINHVVRLDLDNGELLSDIAVENLGPMFTCTQFFDQGNQTFSIIRSDNSIVNVEATTGQIVSEVPVNAGTNIVYYKEDSKTLLAITYEQSTDTNFVEKSNVETGELLSRIGFPSLGGIRLCAITFDDASNSIVTVTGDNLVKYINIDTGEVTDRTQLDPTLVPITIYAQ